MDSAKVVWMDGTMVPFASANISVLSNALHYGTGVFEGIRAYQTPEGAAIFRLPEHTSRLLRSAKAYGIPIEYTAGDFNDVCREVVTANELDAGYIRPLIFYELGSIGLNPASARVRAIVAAWKWGAYLGEEGLAQGIRVRVSSWRRIHQSSFVPTAKGTGQYLNSVLAKQEAVATGYDEAILLNMDGNISEGSGENLFLVRDDVLLTPPVSSGILDGITRGSVMQLLADDGVEVREAVLTRGDLYAADELFFTGTAAEVTPIREVDDRPVGKGEPGPITRRAQDLFAQATSGKLPVYQSWLTYL
ncbi:MAG: branched-chain amino acid transaminase [Acidimicrobiia bacterium]